MNQKSQTFIQIKLFLIYTFSVTWGSWLFVILCNKYFNTLLYGESFFWIPYTIGSLGPAISAYLIYRQFKEDFAAKSFVKYAFGDKIQAKSWLIFGLFLGWRLLMIWISFGISKPISLLSLLVNFPLIIVLGGAEELGWRGILQPKLEKLISYFPSVLVVGTIWSLWHLPLWFMNGSTQSAFPFGLFLVSGIVLTSSSTALYKYTNNLFLCIISHAWFNVCIGFAMYVDSNGTVQLNLNWKVMVVFSIEFLVSVIWGFFHNKHKNNA